MWKNWQRPRDQTRLYLTSTVGGVLATKLQLQGSSQSAHILSHYHTHETQRLGNYADLLNTCRLPTTYIVLCTCSSAGRALCLECRVSWGGTNPRQLIFLRKVTALGVLCCFALLFVWPCLLPSSFLLHLSLTCMWSLPLETYVTVHAWTSHSAAQQ